jgi:hypothetical protein
MRIRLISIFIAFTFGCCNSGLGQEVEGSSGVVELNLKKGSVRSSEGSVSVVLPLKKKEAKGLHDTSLGIAWISPDQSNMITPVEDYRIRASINVEEGIRVVNIFNNDKYLRNIIPPVNTMTHMVVDEEINLNLGSNIIRLEAVTVSGAKFEKDALIVYDISSATFHALVIAVESYLDHAIFDLDQPVKDARRFMDLITTEYTFEDEHVLFLENPTKAEIIGTLHQLRSKISTQDNLLIYYAGHGYWDEEMSTGYWLPSDANRENPVNWLPNTDLTNYLNVLKSKHTLLIADACFSGGIFKTRSAFNNVSSVEKLYNLTSRKAMTSGTLKEVPDQSVFIEYLIRRLDENNMKYLPAEQLFSSLKEAVINNSPNIPQYGTIQNVGDEGGDFIFIRRN